MPLIVSLPRFYGGWLLYLCNNTQHVALQDNVADFRLCCRTFTLNRLIEFLYWHTNYHTEHHVYPGVPCYNLAELHCAIRRDMPACAHGLASVWREIRRALAA
jgi:fatty acid desaturase